jgi:hypothetical protein
VLTKNQIAEVAHEAHAQLCEVLDPEGRWIPSWHELSAEAQVMILSGVEYVQTHPEVGADEIHENWIQDRRAQGWIHGVELDAGLKQHPGMVPFEELPFRDQLKDHMFIAIVTALSRRESNVTT